MDTGLLNQEKIAIGVMESQLPWEEKKFRKKSIIY
jgi:hypothetical protein